MPAGKKAHQDAVELHQKAAAQHLLAADAHAKAAVPNLVAGNDIAAKLDNTAEKLHRSAAAEHQTAAIKHQTATRQSLQRPSKRQKASTASQKAGNLSSQAASATKQAAAADQIPSSSIDSAKQQAVQDGVTQGKLAQQLSSQAVATGTEAAQEGQAALDVGNTDGGWINSILEQLNLTGLTKTMLDHNRFFTLSLIIGAVIVVFFFGTEPKVDNPFYNKNSVNCCNPCQAKGSSSQPTNPICNDVYKLVGSSAQNPFSDYKMVTEAELKTELDIYVSDAKVRIARLQANLQLQGQQVADAEQKIEAQKAALASALKTVTTLAVASAPATGPVGPLIGVLSGLLAAGLAGDNVRKQTVVAKTPNAETAVE